MESYKGDSELWDAGDLNTMLAVGKLGVVVHYGETSEAACAAQLEALRRNYGKNLSYICSDMEGYQHYKVLPSAVSATGWSS